MSILMRHEDQELRMEASDVLCKASPQERIAVEHLLLECKRVNVKYKHRLVVAFVSGIAIGVLMI